MAFFFVRIIIPFIFLAEIIFFISPGTSKSFIDKKAKTKAKISISKKTINISQKSKFKSQKLKFKSQKLK